MFLNYFAGWIATDGHLRKRDNGITIKLHHQDVEILKLFCSQLNLSDNKIKDVIREGCSLQKSLSIYDKQLQLTLINQFNLTKGNKTYTVTCPSFTDEPEFRLYLRGAIEGDGNIRLNLAGTAKVKIVSGSENFVKTLCSEIDKFYSLTYSTYKEERNNGENKLYNIEFTGWSALDLLNHVYKDFPDLRLSRKHKSFQEIQQMYSSKTRPTVITYNEEQLIKLFIEEDKSIKEISNLLNMNESTLGVHLKRAGISKRLLKPAYNLEELRELHINQNMSVVDLAKHYGKNVNTIRCALNKHGIYNGKRYNKS